MRRARDNPFSIDRVLKIRYRPQGLKWETLMDRLAGLHYRGAIVGPKGTGKSTLLEDLTPRLKDRGLDTQSLRLDAEHRRFSPGFLRTFFAKLKANDVILLDGAEQMNWFDWRRFRQRSQRAAGLVITVHAPGRLPTWIQCRTSPQLLTEIAVEMLQTTPEQVSPRANTLFQKHHGNLREALLEWYDLATSDAYPASCRDSANSDGSH